LNLLRGGGFSQETSQETLGSYLSAGGDSRKFLDSLRPSLIIENDPFSIIAFLSTPADSAEGVLVGFSRERAMVYTDAQSWLDAHELIECKQLKGRWTRRTCLEISRRGSKGPRNAKSLDNTAASRTLPCANCPILAALEK
jgi:hypothetical protein